MIVKVGGNGKAKHFREGFHAAARGKAGLNVYMAGTTRSKSAIRYSPEFEHLRIPRRKMFLPSPRTGHWF